MSTPTDRAVASDRDAILAHIHGLFQAYLRGDREAIRRGHTGDWKGFQLPSRAIVRGLDDYMQTADRVLASFRGLRYEILDADVEVIGDRAIVFYVAREWVATESGGEREILLRAIDLYRREPEGWNQCGSHIALAPQPAGQAGGEATEKAP
jgi:ketosteroid isomerase-like protein